MRTDFDIDLRPVEEKDYELPKISYSNLSTFEHCPMQWKYKYLDHMYPEVSSLAMEIGTILHKGMELKAEAIQIGKEVNYTFLKDQIMNGCDEVTDKNTQHLLGINELKGKYWEDWGEPDKFGRTYDQKLDLYFSEVLPSRMEDKDWEIVGCEISFEYVYDNRIRVQGFIDRVDRDRNTGKYRVVDYKSSKKVFPDSEIKTPLQMYFYDCAIFVLYGQIPTEHEYDFILLDKQQCSPEICTKGYLKRGAKKVNKLLDSMDDVRNTLMAAPKPTPLCYWCPYHTNSPNADPKYRGTCQYHLLWTPTQRNFNVLNEWSKERINNNIDNNKKRTLIF
ncbi:MAG: hypothetical protein [Bacteriophage sp.]|nr:MAG: hypothetical protein [Bacteriophage sp.]